MEKNKQEYWRWTESNWRNPDINPGDVELFTVGIDVGSVSSQAVIAADGEVYAYGSMRTGSDSPTSAVNALNYAIEAAGIDRERVNYTVGTGYGRINVPFADRTLTEIACHARGANYIYGDKVRTVLDVGGQDIKAIHCDENGKVITFMMNDKCAAGTGRGMEILADLLGVPIDEVGDRSFAFEGDEPAPVSSVCVIYAKTEATGLLRKGWSTEQVLAAYCRAMAERIYSLVKRIGMEKEFAVTGGMSKNSGVMDRVMKLAGIERITTQWDTQIAGAIGAAIFGHSLCKNKKRKKRRRR
ncbi:MAG: benzoyl-CoA reductase, bzd-type, subunit Q [Desulfobacterales bacterium]|jgi:benzoyl-CoA reductase subunit A|nr:benzoyl-CoA reductase, bzd-type, subunit Q [Desulfobacteraceae bacterium]MBT4363627.1 benzoyl-CoA reductase, bzd-type, subunit Q [Desulfobacteraceae bacterium]MBT7084596.1 benzoyl-CoA reductase, bzd-type, subunit Q [Desulfobacterales bacterium]MBT7697666.1 benzoyl-CoA reductase, bzd-type, subunit Q [Desulfobacterales bacterium]